MKQTIFAAIAVLGIQGAFASWDGKEYWAPIKDTPTGTETIDGVAWKYYVYENYNYAVVWPAGSLPNEVVIPEEIGGYSVGEFYGVTGSGGWSVSIPGSVRVIERANFTGGFDSLTNVTVREDTAIATKIEEGAFKDCTSLQSVILGEGVDEVERWSFNGCTSLQKVVLPHSLRRLGSAAFSPDFDYYANPSELPFLEGDEYNNYYLGDWLVAGESPAHIREGTRGLGDDSMGNAWETPELPEGLEYIGERSCGSMMPYYIPDSVKFIGSFAFGVSFVWFDYSYGGYVPETDENGICYLDGWCFGPASIEEWNRDELEIIRQEAEMYGNEDWYKEQIEQDWWKEWVAQLEEMMAQKGHLVIREGTKGIASGAFNASGMGDNYTLRSVEFPSSLLYIGDNAFERCFNLESFSVPSNVVTIGKFAFSQCTSLHDVDLGRKLKTLEYGAFYEIYNLTNIYCAVERFETLSLYSYYHREWQQWLGPGNYKTYVDHFEGPVKNLHLYSPVKYVGRPAWHEVNYIFEEGVTEIETVIGGEGAGEVVIPSTVTNIDENAFAACPNLSNVVIKIVNSADVKFTGKVFNDKYKIKVVALPYNAKGYEDLIAQLGEDKVKFTVGTEEGFGQWVLVNGLAGKGSAADFGGKSGGNKYENGFLYIFGNEIENESVQLIQLDKTNDGRIAFRIPETEHEDKVRVVGTSDLSDWSNAVELKKEGDVWVMPDGTKPPESFFCRVIISE